MTDFGKNSNVGKQDDLCANIGFEAKLWPVAGKVDCYVANPEGQNEYEAGSVSWVQPTARWASLQSSAKHPTSGKIVDDTIFAIECDNPRRL